MFITFEVILVYIKSRLSKCVLCKIYNFQETKKKVMKTACFTKKNMSISDLLNRIAKQFKYN